MRNVYLVRSNKPADIKNFRKTVVKADDKMQYTLCEPWTPKELKTIAKKLGKRVSKKDSPADVRKKLAKHDKANEHKLK